MRWYPANADIVLTNRILQPFKYIIANELYIVYSNTRV